MEDRLTEWYEAKEVSTYLPKKDLKDAANLGEFIWKLAKLEDIEEELGGISLINRVVYVQAYKHIVKGEIVSINFDDKSFLVEIDEIGIPHDIGLYFVNDKGKTWWLEKPEELK